MIALERGSVSIGGEALFLEDWRLLLANAPEGFLARIALFG